ncbi:MAG TPA: Hsp20/alpha crystallin family protein [Deltaproteobacteria bacterium]|nr:Hsp20/alpha crystallin family protein [Deltaproteobacteria bacterium]
MDIRKLNPWNWFKHEKEESRSVPVRRGEARGEGSELPAVYSRDHIWNIHRELDRLFDDMFSRFDLAFPRLFERETALERLPGAVLRPSVDVKESAREYTITVEVPGVSEDDVKVELADGVLTISGEKKHEEEKKDEYYHSVERSYGYFRRVLSLPDDADEEGVEAKYKNGVLTITVPRRESAASKEKVKVIDVKKAD